MNIGISYGGYATLVGMSFTPDVFQCGVDAVGPANLITLLETLPAYWEPGRISLEKRMGANNKTQAGC
jgi:dipeptidyl aminopeptidase/acylaminoacyl peptidase